MVNVDEPVEVVEADPRWPIRFGEEAAKLRRALGSTAIAIEHIGSTAVPGLAAKPIVDVLIGVAELCEDSTLTGALASLGYEAFGEAGVPGRLYFRKRGPTSFNVHIVSFGGEHWRTNLAVRDYLRAHPERAAEYARCKWEAANRCRGLLSYSQHKAAFMGELVRAALSWREAV